MWTLVVEGGGAIVGLFLVLWVLLMWSWNRSIQLAPPRVRGLSAQEEPRYLELITAPAQRRFEKLGFRRAGYLAVQPIGAEDPEIAQLVMRNDDTHTLAYFHARAPLTAERPTTVSFESILPDGSPFGTRERIAFIVGPQLPNRRRSPAPDDESVYRDHLATLARSGLPTMELPASFDELVGLNELDASRLWQRRLREQVVVPARGPGYRYSRWHSLSCLPALLFLLLRLKIEDARRRRLDRARGPVVDLKAPEIQQFLAERARHKKEVAAAVSNKFKMSRTRTTLLWIAMTIGFTIMWQFLNHRPR